jgi:hypothetical protein
MKLGFARMSAQTAVVLVGFLKPAVADDSANYLFMASKARPEITIVDSTTDEVVGRITLPGIPGDIAALEQGRSLAIADPSASQIRFVDIPNRRVARVVDVPVVPDVLRSDRTGSTLAALDLHSGKVSLSSTASGAFHAVPDISDASYIVFDAKGRLLVARQSGATIVDSAGRRVAELAVDRADGPVTDVAADPGGEYAFVEQPLRGVVSVFDIHNAVRVSVLHLPTPLGRIIPSLDSQFVVIPAGEKSISVISMWTLKEKVRFDVGVAPDSLGLAFFQSVAVIIGRSEQGVFLYDLWNNRSIGGIRLPSRPGSGAPTSDGSKFYVTLPDTGQVAAINLATRRIDHLIDGAGIGVWTVVTADGNGYCH